MITLDDLKREVQEEERPIPGFPPIYTVTKCGKIFSYANGNKKQKSFFSLKGYYRVTLSSPDKGAGKSEFILVHRCVALAWIPNPDNKPFVLHKDDVKTHNHVSNLYWGNNRDNQLDAMRNGIKPCGSRFPTSKLKDEDIEWIRKNYKARTKLYGIRPIAEKFNVGYATIRKIVRGQTYKKAMIAAAQKGDGK